MNSYRFHVYYWQYADRLLVADRWGECDVISEHNEGTYFSRVRPASRMPKTLIYLGPL